MDSLATKVCYKPFVGFSLPNNLFVVYWELDKDVGGNVCICFNGRMVFWTPLKEVISIKIQAGVGVIVCHSISRQLPSKEIKERQSQDADLALY